MLSCRGKCNLFNNLITQTRFGVWQKDNARMCSICSIYFISDLIICPCCSAKLRTRPHSRRGKDRLKNITGDING